VAHTVSRFLSREYAGLIELATRWLDLLGGVLSALLALAVFGADLSGEAARDWVLLVLIHLLLSLFTFQQGELYRSWRGRPYSDQFARLMLAWAVASALTVTAWIAVGLQPLISGWLLGLWLGLQLIVVGGQRAALHLSVRRFRRLGGNPKRVVIYGAGPLGQSIFRQTLASPESGFQVIGFLDDDDRLHGHVLNGQRIYSPVDLEQLVSTLKISDVLLAMPSISRQRRNQILNRIRSAHVSVRTLPSVTDLAQGRVSVNDLRELDIDDLLGRDPVVPNHILLTKNILSKVVLVTGAGGSIGSELCRQILAIGPAKLLLIDQSEFALYQIHHELEGRLADKQGPFTTLLPLLASVQDKDRLREIMSTWRPDTVYHAAAYKHVPLVEHNPAEGIKNNVIGTLRTAQAAIDNGVSDFVLVSTDKAVRPTNIMGASKRLAEQVLQALAQQNTRTRFSMVRFGNVLGSSGSVVPKFRQQIRDGGPISLTHPEITRFFMTIPEAAQLVIQAGAMAKGGDVFVLDMGEPVRIADLARRMVELSGLTIKDELNPDGDIEIQITGLRPGEKLFEELLIGDNPEKTSHARIMRAQETFLNWGQLEGKLASLDWALQVNDVNVIRSMMLELVPGYQPTSDIVDWVYVEQEANSA